mgnify:CR=1 FL=1
MSSLKEPYCWVSKKKGTVVNNPTDIEKYPGIRDLMNKINNKFGFKLNSALATYYKDGRVNCRLHDDAEAVLDPNQPICVVSFGVKRKVDFMYKGNQSTKQT